MELRRLETRWTTTFRPTHGLRSRPLRASELEVIGRNLLSRRQIEFFPSAGTPGRGGAIERQGRARLSWIF